MAGRAAIPKCCRSGVAETARVRLLLGGYPEVMQRRADAGLVQLLTYLERDVGAVLNVRDLALVPAISCAAGGPPWADHRPTWPRRLESPCVSESTVAIRPSVFPDRHAGITSVLD
jgi:hypothetical protein